MATIVIPCFNEASRLERDSVQQLLDAGHRVVLVDDGSTDGTPELLAALVAGASAHGNSLAVLTLPRNRGKAEAVRAGLLSAIDDGATEVAYLDADFATPSFEMVRLLDVLRARPELDGVVGSRVLLLGRDIRRSSARHYSGRVFATVAAWAIGIPIYDTQCGAKAFRVDERLRRALATRFASRWAFDVELLQRLLTPGLVAGGGAAATVVEEPLLQWHDEPGSKLRLGSMVAATVSVAWLGVHRFRRRVRHAPVVS